MIKVTKGAKQYLKELLQASAREPDIGLRLALAAPGKTGLVLDRESPGDQVIEHEGSKVLLVGHEVAQLFAQSTLDTTDTPDGTKLVISKGRPEPGSGEAI